jgi:ABC-type glycerol-3-phosphate transport system substrate-binding protein
MRRTYSLMALLLAASALACSSGQPETETTPSPAAPAAAGAGMAQVVTHTFSNPNEFVRVNLNAGATYRAELDGRGIRLQITPMQSGMQAPLVEEMIAGMSAGGGTAFTIRPRVNGEYEIKAVGGDPGKPVTLRLSQEPTKQE